MVDQVKQAKQSSNLKGFKDKAVLNMGSLDIERAADLIKMAHFYFFNAERDRQLTTLHLAISALRNAYVCFRQMAPTKTAERVDKLFEGLITNIKDARKNRIPRYYNVLFDKLLDDSYELFRVFYELKQNVGLGVPTERLRTSLEKLEGAAGL